MEDKHQQPDQEQGKGAADGLAAYLAAEKEEEAWLEKMQAAAKAKKEDKPTSR
jgi:hypothetical protein